MITITLKCNQLQITTCLLSKALFLRNRGFFEENLTVAKHVHHIALIIPNDNAIESLNIGK
jgi:hypothetical protein